MPPTRRPTPPTHARRVALLASCLFAASGVCWVLLSGRRTGGHALGDQSLAPPLLGWACLALLSLGIFAAVRAMFARAVGQASLDTHRDGEGLDAEVNRLRKQNRDLAEQVKAARAAVEAANQAKSDFLSNTSHELRTPLNAVIGFSEVLQDQLSGSLNPKQLEYISDILENGRYLLNLINTILDLAMVESGRTELLYSRISVSDILKSCLSKHQEAAVRRGIDLSYENLVGEEASFDGDVTKIKQIMANIINNAVKFTPPGGSVVVSVREVSGPSPAPSHPDARGDRWVEFRVRDTGIGIKVDDFPKLFREFTQLESGYTKLYKGTGLGLALTRKLIEVHGGQIWVESEFGKGSTFAFVLPSSARRTRVCSPTQGENGVVPISG